MSEVIEETPLEGESVETVEAVVEETTEEAVVPETEEESTTSEDVTEAAEKPKRRSRAQERIDALTREKYEAQQRAEQAAQQLRQVQEAIQQRQIESAADLPMPTLESVNYDEQAYQLAVAQWSNQKIQKQQEQQMEIQRQHQARQQQEQLQATVAQKYQEGIAKYPDFATKVGSMPSLQSISEPAYAAMIESDRSVDVAYYLANNPQEMYALANVSPVQAVRKMVEIETRLAAKPKPAAQMPPKPPTKVSGAGSEAVKDPSKMSAAEFIEWRNSQLAKK